MSYEREKKKRGDRGKVTKRQTGKDRERERLGRGLWAFAIIFQEGGGKKSPRYIKKSLK